MLWSPNPALPVSNKLKIWYNHILIWARSSLVERFTDNEEVDSSILSGPTPVSFLVTFCPLSLAFFLIDKVE